MTIIERIEAIAAIMQAAKDQGAGRVTASLDDLSFADVAAACKHYGEEPRMDKWWYVSLGIGGVTITLYSVKRTEVEERKVETFSLLEQEIAAQQPATT